MPLRIKFDRLCEEIQANEACGHVLDDADDDLQVFRQLMAMGISRLQHTEFKFLRRWELQFNPLRALRPPRMTGAPVQGISAPFNPDGFNFNRPYLRKEILWAGSLAGRHTALFYNKFPFVDLHGLLVPEPRREQPQLLNEEDHNYVWELTQELASTLPDVGFGYNSYGAFASVNHLHFQMFQRDHALPIANPQWRHNGGALAYPATCFRFSAAGPAWRFIAELHRREISYNLIYLPNRLYCLPRLKQDAYQQPAWTGGFAWYEMAGGYTTYSAEDFEAVDSTDIEAALKQLSFDPVCGLG